MIKLSKKSTNCCNHKCQQLPPWQYKKLTINGSVTYYGIVCNIFNTLAEYLNFEWVLFSWLNSVCNWCFLIYISFNLCYPKCFNFSCCVIIILQLWNQRTQWWNVWGSSSKWILVWNCWWNYQKSKLKYKLLHLNHLQYFTCSWGEVNQFSDKLPMFLLLDSVTASALFHLWHGKKTEILWNLSLHTSACLL